MRAMFIYIPIPCIDQWWLSLKVPQSRIARAARGEAGQTADDRKGVRKRFGQADQSCSKEATKGTLSAPFVEFDFISQCAAASGWHIGPPPAWLPPCLWARQCRVRQCQRPYHDPLRCAKT